ncbi:oxidoreductase [Bacillus sp. DJP31]|uniref:oxidoreductase n=1 Tax=Bacillus sp. DJP31 TaxID=3409789 RepID=UPI003BB731D7
MDQLIAVVTGSSSGFGLETCLEFASRGYLVIATMRDTEKRTRLMELATKQGLDGYLDIQPLDVTDGSSIMAWSHYMNRIGRIDVLVNNAGYAGAGFVEEIPLDEYRNQFETNVFGVIAVTQVVLPFMREAGKGKIINLSSISGRIAFPGLSPYIASKHALEGWSESLRLEMKPFGVDVANVEPGSFQTGIWSTGKQITEKSLQTDSPYYETMQKIEKYIKDGEPKYEDPHLVARLIADIAEKENPTFRHPIGKGVRIGIALKNSIPWKYWERMFFSKMK